MWLYLPPRSLLASDLATFAAGREPAGIRLEVGLDIMGTDHVNAAPELFIHQIEGPVLKLV